MKHDTSQPVPDEKTRKVPYGPVAALLVTVGVYFGSQFIAGIVLSFVPLVSSVSADRLNDWLRDDVTGQFAAVLLIEAATLGLLWLFMKLRKVSWSSLGLIRPRLPRDAAYALVAYLVYFAGFIVLTTFVKYFLPGLDLEQEQEILFDKGVTGSALWLVFVSLVILPPVTEEIVMRGFLYKGLRSRLSLALTAVITSVLFAAAHLQISSGNPLLWVAALDTFILSLILVYLREKSASLWPPIFVHMIKNGLAFTLLFIFKVT